MKIPELIEKKKRYFGTYAVMALMNAQTVLDHIQKVTDLPIIPYKDKEGKEVEPREEDLWLHPVMRYLQQVTYNDDEWPEKTLAVMDRLQRYFPFLKWMAENQRDHYNKKDGTNRKEINSRDLHGILDVVFKVVKKYRDTTTHFVAEDDCWQDGSKFLSNEQRLAIIVNDYYTTALRLLKERYSYTTEELAFIQDHRYKKERGANGKPSTRIDTTFFLSMEDYNGDKTKKLHLSGVGVAQLICLFLDKQYINQMVAHLSLTSKYMPKSKEAQIIRRSLGMCSIVLPKDRLQSDKSDMSVAMDMLGEIKRCPDELFDTLSADKQSRFRVISSDHNEVLLKRSTDRFAQLALQYIDYGRLFDGIRFHVNMGKLRYLFNAEKHCVDGQTRVRVIEHPLNGYGRIDEMEALRKQDDGTFGNSHVVIRDFENVCRDDDDPAHYPYIVDTYTHYMLDGNHVEMMFTSEPVMPEPKEYKGKWHVNKQAPSCRMSILELPAMMFHMHLLGNKRTEAKIKETYDRYKDLFDKLGKGQVTPEVLSSYGIDEKDLPQRVVDVVKGASKRKDIHAFAKKTIEEMYEETCKRIDHLKNDKRAVGSAANKMGKRGFVRIQPGKLADWLMQDIVRWQPSLLTDEDYGTDKLTGLNYRVLQSAIAMYDSNGDREKQDQFKAMFEQAGLIGGNRKANHPFLYRVFGRMPGNAIDFYESYLYKRKAHLQNLMSRLDSGENIIGSLPFINPDQNKWKKQTPDVLGKEYTTDKAIILPRQMFDDDIKEHLKGMPEMKGVDFDHANVTFLIGEYMKRVRKDDFQDFYAWKRNYRYIDMLMLNTDKRGALCANMTTTEEREKIWKERATKAKNYRNWCDKRLQNQPQTRRLKAEEREEIISKRLVNSRNDYQKSEKVIRRYKVQDALLFMMACDTLTKYADFEGKQFKLKEIMPDADRGILSEAMPMDFQFVKNGQEYVIHADGMKIKNYGDFFVLAHDKRLPNLLELVGQNRILKDDLTQELKRYDVCRPGMVEMVFDLEKWAFETYPSLLEQVRNGVKLRFKDILAEIEKNGTITPEQKCILLKIRNAFEHNNYPEKGIVEVVTLPEIAENMKNLFGKYATIK